jgi:hypothetical protein
MISAEDTKSDSTKQKDLHLIICPNDEEMSDEELAELLEKQVQDLLEES